MMTTKTNKTLLVIAGPTAVGKTELSIHIARKLKTEIISADARQFYRELPVGAAIPTPEELQKTPHHLIGHLSINDYYNAALYEKHALAIIEKLFRFSDHAIVTGGSGLYIDTLCRGIDALPDPDPVLREKVRQVYLEEGLVALRQWVKKVDPGYYRQVDQANPKRMMRALEVFLTTGMRFSTLRKQRFKERPFFIRRIVLDRPRQELFDRINSRTDGMIQQGLIEEAIGLYRCRHLNALNTLGYKEIFDWLANKYSLHTAVNKIKTNTRRYAKRQLTWFKRYHDAAWFHPHEKEKIMHWICDGAPTRRSCQP